MHHFLIDHIYDEKKEIVTGAVFKLEIEHIWDTFDREFMEAHYERPDGLTALRLRLEEEVLAEYPTQFDATVESQE